MDQNGGNLGVHMIIKFNPPAEVALTLRGVNKIVGVYMLEEAKKLLDQIFAQATSSIVPATQLPPFRGGARDE